MRHWYQCDGAVIVLELLVMFCEGKAVRQGGIRWQTGRGPAGKGKDGGVKAEKQGVTECTVTCMQEESAESGIYPRQSHCAQM